MRELLLHTMITHLLSELRENLLKAVVNLIHQVNYDPNGTPSLRFYSDAKFISLIAIHLEKIFIEQ